MEHLGYGNLYVMFMGNLTERVQVVEATSSHGIMIYPPENQHGNGKSPF